MSLLAAGVVALGSMVALYMTGGAHFVDTACANVERVLPAEVVGQDLALGQLTDAVCHHLSQPRPKKPLVLSVHGPPGVGKTYSHLWLARALYSRRPARGLHCPGPACRGYKVVYGLDYLVPEAAGRLDALRGEVVGHLRSSPEALLVVEEYDKMDCAARGLVRQLLQHPERANITTNRAVILLESNLGMAELEEMLSQLGDRRKVTAEGAEALLRGVVFEQWRRAGCGESYEDTLVLLSLIDAFLPFLPLERRHMAQLAELSLRERADLLAAQHARAALTWGPDVPAFLAGKVDFSGPYPLDGAKVIDPAITRQVGRPLRQAMALPGCRAREGCTLALSVDGPRLRVAVRNNTRQQQLQARPAPGGAAGAGAAGKEL
ncbi:TOR1A [Scenedesmus sp. PABB004]|nr:TOR1A [Scenedesmus sp. PABB004]